MVLVRLAYVADLPPPGEIVFWRRNQGARIGPRELAADAEPLHERMINANLDLVLILLNTVD